MRPDLLHLGSDLAKRGEAFALATVVRREPPHSARVGDAALITQGGAFHGWLGGSCTQPVVVREALRALADGRPRLIALSPDPSADRRPGVEAFPMTCHSGGSVDIYIEPQLPAPRLVVLGVSPVAQALTRLAHAVGYTVDAVDPEADRATFPEADRVFTSLEEPQLRLRPGARGAQLFAVVATMGQMDEEAVAAALALESVYVAVVTSPRRFGLIRTTLLARGVTVEDLERVRAPAGLDIGARTPEEIAVSIIAEIVQVLRAAGPPDLVEAAAPPPGEARDPVCGMTVATATAAHRADFGGRTYYFCCGGCRERFLSNPAVYVAAMEPGTGG
jgi:xanthine dehydrogenase accessory factor